MSGGPLSWFFYAVLSCFVSTTLKKLSLMHHICIFFWDCAWFKTFFGFHSASRQKRAYRWVVHSERWRYSSLISEFCTEWKHGALLVLKRLVVGCWDDLQWCSHATKSHTKRPWCGLPSGETSLLAALDWWCSVEKLEEEILLFHERWIATSGLVDLFCQSLIYPLLK